MTTSKAESGGSQVEQQEKAVEEATQPALEDEHTEKTTIAWPMGVVS